MAEYLFWRKVRRVRVWRGQEWSNDDRRLALDEIYDSHVGEGRGFSLWCVADEADRKAIAAIMFELSGANKVKQCQDYFSIPESGLAALDFKPIPTPHATNSTHERAPELHRDLVGLRESDCLRLAEYLRRCFGDLHTRVQKSEVKAAVREELLCFRSPEVRTRLSRACGLAESP